MATAIIVATTSIHFEALSILSRAIGRRGKNNRITIIAALACVIAAHLVEICIYAVAYALGAGPLHIGHFIPSRPMDHLDFFYYAARPIRRWATETSTLRVSYASLRA